MPATDRHMPCFEHSRTPQGHKFQRDMYGKRVATIDEFPELAGAPAEEGCKPSLATVKPFGKQVRRKNEGDFVIFAHSRLGLASRPIHFGES